MSLYVRVVDGHARPIKGARVVIGFTEFLSAGFSGAKYTNADGIAAFERDERSGEQFTLWVNARRIGGYYEYRIGRTISVAN